MTWVNETYVLNQVSVVIPCYNQSEYLSTAIESILSQSYKSIEIILIDDGSTDNCKQIAGKYKKVKYVYQENQGLSSARNTGIDNCTGEFVVFLDADDWLMEDALLINVHCLQNNPKAVFVSGAYKNYYEKKGEFVDQFKPVKGDPYTNLLQDNYISMIAAVMFRRSVLMEFRFNTCLKVCEDYDLYLRITRYYSVIQHDKIIAIYRFHKRNMSYQLTKMLKGCLTVLNMQKGYLNTIEEKRAYQEGIKFWKAFYAKEALESLFLSIYNPNIINIEEYVRFILEYDKKLYLKYLKAKIWFNVKLFLKI